MNEKITVVFPCAGEASRFGFTFKPFLKIGDISFIEKAIEPFEKWEHLIEKYHFIFTEEQEQNFSVIESLKTMFANKDITFSILSQKTDGPLQTFRKGYIEKQEEGSFIVCDCDHSINVDRLFQSIFNGQDADIIIPTWNINKINQHNWSKILLQNNEIVKFVNKESVDFETYAVKGIIGCIYFKSKKLFYNIGEEYANFHELIAIHFEQKKNIILSDAKNAYFFGDPKMLNDCIEKRRSEGTIFCDVDGVLLEHHNHSTDDPSLNKVLPFYEKLRDLSDKNHKIVLTTARNKKTRLKFIEMLNQKNIYYDELVMGLPSGPRILINDRKPSKPFTTQSNSFEVRRNQGLKEIQCVVDSIMSNNDVQIIEDLSANSFANTYLVQQNNSVFVRKHLLKDQNEKHYKILKRQKTDLERFNFLFSNICPEILNECDNEFEYYYDMKYYPAHTMVSEINNEEQKIKSISKVLEIMNSNIYSLSKNIDGCEWFYNFLKDKIYPKFDNFSLIDNNFEAIINSEQIYINEQRYYGLRKCFELLRDQDLYPDMICPVHGDLTLENILFNIETDEVVLIDMDGSRLFDARELDLGKLSQSIISRYSEWKNIDGNELIQDSVEDKTFLCESKFFEAPNNLLYNNFIHFWSKILGQSDDIIIKKAMFYMSTYFIRFVPFRLQKGNKHGIFALLMAVVYLNKIILGDKNED